MIPKFVNREAELQELNAVAKRGGLFVIYGRRRVGKTRLVQTWLQTRDGYYSQAIEAQRDLQIQQVFEDIRVQFEKRPESAYIIDTSVAREPM